MKSIFFVFVFMGIISVNAQQIKKKTEDCNGSVTCYTVSSDKFILNSWQDVYNALYATVPGIGIRYDQFYQLQKLCMRNQEEHVVYIDGVRSSMEMLKALNPSNIESIVLMPSGVNTVGRYR
ncbi:hypothetical protein NBRC110019_27200 [Neptunitalea chrysea]|uniref:Uncharacterized protein n=1 Tax=Neptunitalea chrysea TaxID=1647581 RepID=A0A9W6B6M3_9FLAO|nr:hypothetical protein [Neptunitalea chrysea]GLB53679.1 hypothetical protein NBRC110019_27200 [Neptunitalea chrysea]